MCGIFCSILYNQSPFLNQLAKNGNFKDSNPQFTECCKYLKQRGPDCYNELHKEISPFAILQCAASVLWMQGEHPVMQPLSDDDGNILMWNGDIFSGPLATEGNDTELLFQRLQSVCRNDLDVPEVFAEIRGPYSFIFYHSKMKRLYFGRDVIGRHSLLIRYESRNITLTSVASRKLDRFMEVPAVGVFEFNLEKDGEVIATIYPWSHIPDEILTDTEFLPPELAEKLQMGPSIKSYLIVPNRRAKNPNRDELEMWATSDQNLSVSQLMDKLSTTDTKTRIEGIMSLLSGRPTVQVLIEDLLSTLRESIRVRIEMLPNLCKACAETFIREKELSNPCDHSKLAVLFSGGLDSSIIAAVVHSIVPMEDPIDLLNVAFEKPSGTLSAAKQTKGQRSTQKNDGTSEVSYMVPDRISGTETLRELSDLCPGRRWNFVEIDVSLDELKKEREHVIGDLIYPLNTVLDESLGCALWFASRGKGVLHGTNEAYTSPARVVLSGIGADEQLGGYMRHRTTLKHKGGWEALDNELQMELRRISRRNLARDDRIVSSHGRQCRMPFLDEDVINFLNFIPPWYKCYPVESMPPGVGDKLLLRLSAWVLGLRNASNLPKRAMQFGSRIAISRERGSDVSERL